MYMYMYIYIYIYIYKCIYSDTFINNFESIHQFKRRARISSICDGSDAPAFRINKLIRNSSLDSIRIDEMIRHD